MKYATAIAFRAALEKRLVTLAQEADVPLVRLRKLVVFDRLLARLMAVSPDRWVLKGAVALHFRLGPRFRTTKDMDLGRQDGEQAATADFIAAQSVDLGDYFTFAIRRMGRLNAMHEGVSVRYHALAELGGRPFEDVTIDVGFGDPVIGAPELVRGPDLLSFADIPPAQVPSLPLEHHVAEKVYAYTRIYASGQTSTRVKDLVDLIMAISHFSLQAGRVRRALDSTFTARGTHPLPTALPSPPPQWHVPYRKMATEVDLDTDMSAGYQQARAFLDPILAGTEPDVARWNSTKRLWQADSS